MSDEPHLRTTHISDAADALGLGTLGAGGFEFLSSVDRLAIGRAYTVRHRLIDPDSDGEPAASRHGEATKTLSAPGDILVIQVDDQTEAATWGEAWTLRALARGLAGVLIDGKTRDRVALQQRGFPVLCRGSSPVRSTGRLTTVAIEQDVVVSGVTIRQGDTIAIDSDGFVCIPAEHAAKVLEGARVVALNEQKRDRELEALIQTAT